MPGLLVSLIATRLHLALRNAHAHPSDGLARGDDQSRHGLRKVSWAIIVHQKIVTGGSNKFFPAYERRNVLPEVLAFENLAPMQHFNQ